MDKENHNFEKNISAIRLKQPVLADYLSGINEIREDIRLTYNHLNEPILTYNGIGLHSDDGAEIEARNIFKKSENTPLSVHIVFGMGLGYLFQEFAQKSMGKVILLEPNLQLLRLTLEYVDFSKELAKSNVMIVSNVNDLKILVSKYYKYKSDVNLSSLPSYREMYKGDFDKLVQVLQTLCGTFISEYNTTKTFVATAAEETSENIPNMIDEIPLMEFKNQLKGKTALVVSAGPTLDMNIESIKKNRNKFVIFCVGTALKAILRNDIKPDFLVIIESKNCRSQIQGVDLSDIYFVLEPSTYHEFHTVKSKKNLLYLGNTNPVNQAFAKLAGLNTDGYDTRGTVSFEALMSAKILGCKKIILVGQDLAYVNNNCYSQSSIFADLKCEVDKKNQKAVISAKDIDSYRKNLYGENSTASEDSQKNFTKFLLERMNSTLYFVKGINGDMIPTEASYATFIEHFKGFAVQNRDMELINTSMLGAQIDGFKNMTFDEAVKDILPIKEKIDLKSDFKIDKKLLLNNVNAEKDFLDKVFNEMSNVESNFNKYDEAYAKTNSVSEETNKYFKILLNYYDQLRTKAGVSSKLFSSISFAQDIEVQYMLTKFANIDQNAIDEVYKALQSYFNVVKSKVKIISEKLKSAKEKIQ